MEEEISDDDLFVAIGTAFEVLTPDRLLPADRFDRYPRNILVDPARKRKEFFGVVEQQGATAGLVRIAHTVSAQMNRKPASHHNPDDTGKRAQNSPPSSGAFEPACDLWLRISHAWVSTVSSEACWSRRPPTTCANTEVRALSAFRPGNFIEIQHQYGTWRSARPSALESLSAMVLEERRELLRGFTQRSRNP